MSASAILVVDDNRDMADGIAMVLGDLGLDVIVAYSARAALRALEEREFSLVVSDVRMPRISGVELLDQIRERWPRTQVMLLTAYGTIDAAVAAMRQGATDYLTKPLDNRDLVAAVERGLARAGGHGDRESARTVSEVAAVLSPDDLFGSLARALEVLRAATHADDGELFLLEPEGRDALLSLWTGSDGDALVERMRFGPDAGYPGIVAAAGRSLAVQGTLADDSRYLRPAVVARGIRSYACTPLVEPRGALGSIHLLSRREDFPADRVVGLLERVAVPITNTIRAGLAALRERIDGAAGEQPEGSTAQVRAVLECLRRAANASEATIALVNPETGLPAEVVSTGPATLMCTHAEAGLWAACGSIAGVHGFAAERGRRGWPLRCRDGVPLRVATPCCLPLAANGRLHGLVTFDLGRHAEESAASRLVPLLVMAQQAAVRLATHRPGLPLERVRNESAPRARVPHAVDLELRCFGPFSIVLGGLPVAPEQFPRSKALTLLALLALHAGTPLTKDYLVERLWPGVDLESGANRLYGIVHALRHVIEPHRSEHHWQFVRSRGDVYYLDLSAPIEIDFVRFRRLLDRAREVTAADPTAAIDLIEQAVALYRGELFADDPYAEWCQDERRESEQQLVDALARLARLHGAHGDLGRAIDHVRTATRLAPYRMDLPRWLAARLTEAGRLDEARAVAEELQHIADVATGADDVSSDPGNRSRLLRPAAPASPPLRIPERGRRDL